MSVRSLRSGQPRTSGGPEPASVPGSSTSPRPPAVAFEREVGAGNATAVAQSSCGSLTATTAQVLGSTGRRAGFVVVGGAVSLLYTILLPFKYTQQLGLANWHYLDPYLGAWSVALGASMSFVLMVQVYAMQRAAAARPSGRGAVAFLMSLLPSLLCCTPMVPTILAFVGVSGASLYFTTGAVAHFFATQQTNFLAASLALLAITGWWSLRRVAAAACLSEGGCSGTDLGTAGDYNNVTPGVPGHMLKGAEDGGH